MLGRVWDFVKRHKRKFIFAGALVGGGILLKNYTVKKIKEWEEKQVTECIERLRKQQHFESTQNTCSTTVLSFVKNIQDEINKHLDTDYLISAMKAKPENRVRIFEDLKILAFSRAITTVYACSLLILQLHVKLSILGGYMYLDTLKKVNGNGDDFSKTSVPLELQQRYLSNVQHLIGPGLEVLVSKVQKAVQAVLGDVSVKETCSIETLDKWIKQIRFIVEHEENGMSFFDDIDVLLLPTDSDCNFAGPSNSTCNNTSKFQGLVDETRDIFESSDCRMVLAQLLSDGFSLLLDYFTEFYGKGPGDASDFTNINELKVALAKLVPVANGLLFTMCSTERSDFLIHLLATEKLKSLSANVYEAFLTDSSGYVLTKG